MLIVLHNSFLMSYKANAIFHKVFLIFKGDSVISVFLNQSCMKFLKSIQLTRFYLILFRSYTENVFENLTFYSVSQAVLTRILREGDLHSCMIFISLFQNLHTYSSCCIDLILTNQPNLVLKSFLKFKMPSPD